MELYELAVLGAGTAGMAIAAEAAAQGWQVALIENRQVGGTCVNDGCIPTKILIHAAHVLKTVNRAHEWGIDPGRVTVDWERVRLRKDNLVRAMVAYAEAEIRSTPAITWISGTARFAGEHVLAVGEREISADRIVIATGTRPMLPAIPGLTDIDYLTSTTALELRTLPARLIIVGGGPVAIEFAQLFARFGTEVTVVERSPQILSFLDEELLAELLPVLREEGINIVTAAEVRQVAGEAGRQRLTATVAGQEQTFEADRIMIAIGRVPNTEQLKLATAGVTVDGRGFVPVNQQLQTNVPHIWALGDVNGGPQFTHRAWHDARRLGQAWFSPAAAEARPQPIPYCIYTDPEVASTGLDEKTARSQGIEIKVQRLPFASIPRAMAMGEERGIIKLISDSASGILLGAQIAGRSAGELIHELVLAVNTRIAVSVLQETIHIHPTLAEGINTAAWEE